MTLLGKMLDFASSFHVTLLGLAIVEFVEQVFIFVSLFFKGTDINLLTNIIFFANSVCAQFVDRYRITSAKWYKPRYIL